ncbi:MAG: hypothetical protein AAFV62_02975 [Pseudomonadota bacterium]
MRIGRMWCALSVVLALTIGTGARAAEETAGLWIGAVTLFQATPLGAAQDAKPVSVASEFSFRFIAHQPSEGQAQLLKEATLIWALARGEVGAASTEERVFASAEGVRASLKALGAVDGRQVRARRFSSPAFAFDGAAREMVGRFGAGQLVQVDLELPSEHPLNPYRHGYHPDFDGVDALGRANNEVPMLRRSISIRFNEGSGAAAADAPLRGTYQERIDGLAAAPLLLAGTITLRRISTVGVLGAEGDGAGADQ